MKLRHSIFLVPCSIFFLGSCSISKQVSKQANATILQDSSVSKGFIGISIYEPATNTYWYNYNATKYFTPASNTKLFSLYAGMKYLGDSLVGIRYKENVESIDILPTGDPTFLHQDFVKQPVYDFLEKSNKHFGQIFLNTKILRKFKKYGPGWAWDDADDDYMTERTDFPIYGNMLRVIIDSDSNIRVIPRLRDSPTPFYKMPANVEADVITENKPIRRLPGNQILINSRFMRPNTVTKIPITDLDGWHLTDMIEDTIFHHNYNKEIFHIDGDDNTIKNADFKIIHSQPTDSLFRPMMHRSDNFFAEQTLLMASNEHLGYMSDANMIDTLLKTDLKDVPQKPKWVDGSGLSRYNLFTPQSFIYILNKLMNEFGWDRIRNILPTGGHGTLTSYYLKDSGFIYAKTGTISNNCALSGFLLTNSGKRVIFSILVNHYQNGATPIRKATEQFLEWIRKKY